MLWLTERERVAFALLGAAALLGLGVLLWQQRHPPLAAAPGPVLALREAEGRVEGPPSAQWDAQLDAATRIDVNRAGADALERLPEIGPSTAQRIIAYREAHGPFRAAEELLNVPGIGPKTLETIRDHLTLQ